MSQKYLKLSMTKSELVILIHLYLFYPKATTSMYLLGLKTKTSSLISLFIISHSVHQQILSALSNTS